MLIVFLYHTGYRVPLALALERTLTEFLEERRCCWIDGRWWKNGDRWGNNMKITSAGQRCTAFHLSSKLWWFVCLFFVLIALTRIKQEVCFLLLSDNLEFTIKKTENKNSITARFEKNYFMQKVNSAICPKWCSPDSKHSGILDYIPFWPTTLAESLPLRKVQLEHFYP
jgi:hypothetical protein